MRQKASSDFAAKMMSKVWREWAKGKKIGQLQKGNMYVGSVIWNDYKNGLQTLTRFTEATPKLYQEPCLMFKGMKVYLDKTAPVFHIRIEG